MGFVHVEIPPDLHKRLHVYALEHDATIKQLVRQALEELVRKHA